MLHRLTTDEEKNDFWEDLDGLIESAKKEERIVLGADLNGHVGEENVGHKERMGRYGAGTRNKEKSMVVDFVIVNLYSRKKDEHKGTYKSGRKSTQVDYVMCRRIQELKGNVRLSGNSESASKWLTKK